MKFIRSQLSIWCPFFICLGLVSGAVDWPRWVQVSSLGIAIVLLVGYLVSIAPAFLNRARERFDRIIWPMLLIGAAIGIFLLSMLFSDDDPITAMWLDTAAMLTGLCGVVVTLTILVANTGDQE